MKVRATKLCFVGNSRKRVGKVFDIDDEQFNKNCMEKVKASTVTEQDEGTGGASTMSVGPRSTVPELKAALDSAGIEYESNAKKAELIALLAPGTPAPKDEGSGEGGDDLT